ncbi:hypothetical protein CIW49_19620 [Mycolicibacterium sp. P1-18]|uniref:hypothetical protein n=1 Tax=Mycolicibacterium sp. P1-18 TaxID=2024615 RepID=UPI0011F3C8B0|nr:hypothetical protein [Mycolicibacterium sp. P1-18]KAA0096856.1 hypothetical protein CIW49_19620 [Mycolicibacterium sp. P1-18]
MVETPTRSRVEGWSSGHLRQAALGWQRQADLTEQTYSRAQHAVDAVPWSGAGADGARAKLVENLAKVRGALALMERAGRIAMAGADVIDAAKRAAVDAIQNAVSQFFEVSENLSVTDRMPAIFSAALALVRKIAAAHLQADIRAKAMMLALADEDVAHQLDAVAEAMQTFDLAGGRGGAAKPGDPQIVGGPTPLTPDGKQGDLSSTIPGTGIEISGDGRTTYPTLNGERNPLEVPGGRPLPTGTIVGPDGKQYALYSEVPYKLPNGQRNPDFATADTTVVDLNDPSKRLGVLPGISQASGAYDPATNRMVIVGNDGPHDRTRRLYMSDPIDPKNPNGWMQTLKPQGEIQGLPGDRESQIVALKGGGFMLVGSDNFDNRLPGDQPIGAVTASTPEGLLTAKATPLFPPGPGAWPGDSAPYGPTVVDTVYDPVTGKETVQLRVSTWEDPPNWDGKGDKPYNPKTYQTQLTVQH